VVGSETCRALACHLAVRRHTADSAIDSCVHNGVWVVEVGTVVSDEVNRGRWAEVGTCQRYDVTTPSVKQDGSN
jgi:hypothetical protein